MKSTGIIVEYNPFHNGHLHHLKEIKKLFKDNIIIAVMSGNFTQRGDTSIIDKWEKTKIALKHGIDLVIELPFQYATSSGDLFAKGALEILNDLKIESIVFGSESNNIDMLYKEANILLNTKITLKNNKSYASNMFKKRNKPNDILGILYIKEIIKNNYNIKPVTIKRDSNYHSKNYNELSALSIRESLKNNINIDNKLPYKFNYKPKFIDDYFNLLKYKILSTDDLNIYNGVDEGLDNRIKKAIFKSNSLDELINNIKSKRYTYSRIKRMLLHILVGYTKDDNKYYLNKNHIRILGFNDKGIKYLNQIKKDTKLSIYSTYNDELRLEYKVSSIYDNNSKNELNKPIKL